MSAEAKPRRTRKPAKDRTRDQPPTAAQKEQAIETVKMATEGGPPIGPDGTVYGQPVEPRRAVVRQRVAYAVQLLGAWWPTPSVRDAIMEHFGVAIATAERDVAIALHRVSRPANSTTEAVRESYRQMFLADHDRAVELGQMSAAVRAGEAAARIEGVYQHTLVVQPGAPVSDEEAAKALADLAETFRFANARRAIDVEGKETPVAAPEPAGKLH